MGSTSIDNALVNTMFTIEVTAKVTCVDYVDILLRSFNVYECRYIKLMDMLLLFF